MVLYFINFWYYMQGAMVNNEILLGILCYSYKSICKNDQIYGRIVYGNWITIMHKHTHHSLFKYFKEKISWWYYNHSICQTHPNSIFSSPQERNKISWSLISLTPLVKKLKLAILPSLYLLYSYSSILCPILTLQMYYEFNYYFKQCKLKILTTYYS